MAKPQSDEEQLLKRHGMESAILMPRVIVERLLTLLRELDARRSMDDTIGRE